MTEQSKKVCKKYTSDILWMFGAAGILILWCIFLCLQCFCKDIVTGEFFLNIIPHVVFLSLFFTSAVISYKTFKIQSEMQEKEDEVQRKIRLENLQQGKYEKNQEQKQNDSNIEAKIKEVFKSLMEEQEYHYRESLKMLDSNLKLFNEVKEKIENFINKKNTRNKS